MKPTDSMSRALLARPKSSLPRLILGLLILLCTGCSPLSSAAIDRFNASGAGNGDAGGVWTEHFRVGSAPWKFGVRMDCSRARMWGFDVTLEQMHDRGYFDAVPINLGWSSGQGPASSTTSRSIQRAGEFWFIVRSATGCTWKIRVTAG